MNFCQYCGEAARKGSLSCTDCQFKCIECSGIYGYEFGHGDCVSCDWCCANHGENHIPYIQPTRYLTWR